MRVFTWAEIQARLMSLTIKNGGPSKSNSGTVTIVYGKTVDVTFGCYDIGDTPSLLHVGSFPSEKLALKAANKAINKLDPYYWSKIEDIPKNLRDRNFRVDLEYNCAPGEVSLETTRPIPFGVLKAYKHDIKKRGVYLCP